jgi:CRP-like cAMP-binding protein
MHLGALPPAFAGLSTQHANEAAAFLESTEMDSGDVLMVQGEEDFTLAFLVTGHATITDSDVRIGGAAARDLVGEVELFGKMPRTATVVAAAPTQLLVLAYERWLDLCASGNPAAYNIERYAERRVTERFRHLAEGIAERSGGGPTPNPVQRSPGFMERLSRMWSGPPGGAVDVLAELQASPMFDGVDLAYLAVVAPSFRAERILEGTEIVRQGLVTDRAFMIVEGNVDMYVMTGERSGVPIARLGKGDAFGDAGLALHAPSVPSFFAATDCVVLSIGADHFGALFAADEAVGSAFRQGFLNNLIRQFLAAQRRYVEFEQGILARMDENYRGTPMAAIWRD